MWTTLNFEGGSKVKKRAIDICKGTLDIEFERDRSIGIGSTDWRRKKKRARDIWKGTLYIEFERDWSVSSGATLGEGQKIKNYYLVLGFFFSGKADSVILLGFECIINPQILIKIVRAIFQKIEIFFYLCELSLILGLGGKLKKTARDICMRTLYI